MEDDGNPSKYMVISRLIYDERERRNEYYLLRLANDAILMK